jgi:Flp pilus assembly protein TadD/mono/diheme cytochrome c family protein
MRPIPQVAAHCVFVTGLAAALLFGTRSSVKAAVAPNDADLHPTWARNVAPILHTHCTTCHHPGGAGPFSLLTYADAKRWGAQVVKVTQSRYMPPWLPEPGHGDFADNRRLPDADLALVKKWFAAGMPEGDAKAAPAAPVYDATWQIGKPDLILKQSQPFTLAAGGTDVFRNFVFPYSLKEGHYIRAMEIRPGAPQVVHHANVLIDRTGSFRRQHPSDWQAGVPGMEILLDAGNTFDPDSHFLFWKPDTPALVEPEGMPWRLDPGNDLILNIHLKPSGKAETVDAEIGLYFTDKPPTKQPMLLQLDRDDALDIPAGDKDFTVEDELKLPVDVEALGVYPHAHYLGKDMEAWAVLPDGEKKWLVWIRDWDIDRQAVYRYREPMRLPKGTVLHIRYVYDNSAANPRNPHNPPTRVRAGNRSEDEMAHLWLQVLPVVADPKGPDPRLQLEVAWMRNRLRHTPNDRISLYNLAAALAGEGKFDEAVPEFQQVLKLAPGDAETLTALGAALDGAGDWQGARATLEQAANSPTAEKQQVCDARFDLASLDLRHEEHAAAVTELRAELAACPDDADAHELLARSYAQDGNLDGAEKELREAARLKPDAPQIHSELAQVLGQAGKLEAAVAEQQTALKLAPDDADGWNNLGVLEARTGKTDAARGDFEHALRLQPDHAQARANLARLAH